VLVLVLVLVRHTRIGSLCRGRKMSGARDAWEELITNELLQSFDAFLSPFRPFLDTS
jgi:hypothetical protein